MYLLDTNVLSASGPSRSHADVIRWMDENAAQLYLSTITIAEIGSGIAKAKRTGATRKGRMAEKWLDGVLLLYGSRILPFDLKAARSAGALTDLAKGKGHTADFADVAIAATAKSRGMTVLTRNTKHFVPFEVLYHDPFLRLPP